jgi:hypothetical protein
MITFDLQDEEMVARAVASFAEATGRSMVEQIIATARLVCVSLATSTQPYGLGKDVHTGMQAKISRQIGLVFRTPPSVFAELKRRAPAAAPTFWKAYQDHDISFMSEIMSANGINLTIAASPSPELHAKARTKKGNVHKNYQARQLVTEQAPFEWYILKKQSMAGFAKAGWAKAADACGGHRGIPAWASSEHGSAPGGARISRDPVRPSVVIENNVRYISDVITEAEIENAIRIAYERTLKQIAAITAANARKAKLASKAAA